jgi:hypothetical protein
MPNIGEAPHDPPWLSGIKRSVAEIRYLFVHSRRVA